jgi:HD-GYP domain-containing protein (c-di-GMP phosphodiesterase class II)
MSKPFLPIRLNTLRADEVVSFDIYLKLGDRYVHYTHRQDELEGERLRKLKENGVKKFFINPSDEDAYLKYLEVGIDHLSDNSKDINARGALAHDSMMMAAANAEKTLETQEGFNAQKKQFEKISNFIISDRNAIKSMLAFAGISTDNDHHAANVSSLTLAVATKAGITDPVEIFELGTAALLHDIGKNRLSLDKNKSKEKMSPEELKIFKRHPQEAVDMLSGKPYISPRILGLILSHEEIGEGRGFPEKKNLFAQPPAYQILSMVNQFDHFSSENNLQPFLAVDPFFEKFGKDFDQELITIMASVLT